MSNDLSHLGGWIDDPKGVEESMSKLPIPVFSSVWSATKESGKGKKMLLYDIVRKVVGNFPNRLQKIGDCVSMASAGATDIAKCVDIFIKGDFEQWVNETSTEDIYSGSRNLIGGGRLTADGSLGSWAAEYVNQYGGLPRGKYGNIDTTKYDGDRARSWGRSGFSLPKEFLDISKKHPILTVSQVNSWEEVRDLIHNGYAVTIASNQGFSSLRDKDGFSKPEGSWAHAMCIIGMDDESSRVGACINNSWGLNWNSGPKRFDQPDGSFWVDASELENRILKTGDCWAYSGYEGFQPNKLNTRII